MAENKKYYWLKLKEDFFEEKQIKYLRSLPDGDKLLIAYLKMQLKSLKTEGFIQYDKILPSNIEELAMILDEDINIVKLMISALQQVGAIEILDDGSFYMIAMQDLIGKEGESAERVRQFRQREKQKALQCNNDVTKCNIEIEIRDREKRKDKDIEIDKNIYAQNSSEKAKVLEKWQTQFKQFYDEYPRKVAKKNVESWFKNNKPNDELFNLIMQKLEIFKQSKDWQKNNGQYIPYPSTWLNQKRWEDENIEVTSQNALKEIWEELNNE